MFWDTVKISVDFVVLACLTIGQFFISMNKENSNLLLHRISSILGFLCFLSLFIMFGIAKSFTAASIILLISIFCTFCCISYLLDYSKKYNKVVVFFWPIIVIALYGLIRPML